MRDMLTTSSINHINYFEALGRLCMERSWGDETKIAGEIIEDSGRRIFYKLPALKVRLSRSSTLKKIMFNKFIILINL